MKSPKSAHYDRSQKRKIRPLPNYSNGTTWVFSFSAVVHADHMFGYRCFGDVILSRIQGDGRLTHLISMLPLHLRFQHLKQMFQPT